MWMIQIKYTRCSEGKRESIIYLNKFQDIKILNIWTFWKISALGFLWKEWCWSWNSSTWPPHAKSWLIGKDSDAGRDWGQEEKGTTEDEMAGWYHKLNGCEFEWTPGVGDGQGGLACCNSWGRKESDTTERLNWTELMAAKELFHLF